MSMLSGAWIAALLCLALLLRLRPRWQRPLARVAAAGCAALGLAVIAAGLFGVSDRLALSAVADVRLDGTNMAFLATGLLAAAAWLPGRTDPGNLVRVAGALLAMAAGDASTLAVGASLAWVPGLAGSLTPALPGIGGVAWAGAAVGWTAVGAPVPALPGWAGLPLMAAGPALAAAAAWQAGRASDLPAAAQGIDRAQAGLVVAALGTALAARGADQTALAAGALAGLLLLTASRAATAVLLAMLRARIGQGAGSTALDRLGALAASMPGTSGLAAIAAVTVAGLPIGGDFAGLWLLVQAMLGVARIGGGFAQMAVAFGLLGLALGWTARTRAVVRASLAFLGRPRTPRTSAAEEHGRDIPAWLAASALLLLGVVPTLPWRLLHPNEARPPLLGALPLPSLPAVLLIAGACVVTIRARAADLRGGGRRLVPAWRDGAAADPPWLPFGDPRTQAQPSDLAWPATTGWPMRGVPTAWLAGLPRRWTALATGVLVLAALLLAGLR